MTFTTEGSAFDTVLWITQTNACPGTAVPGGCNDDTAGSLQAALDLTLDPGEYFIFLTGFSTAARGNYTLTVAPSTMTP